MVCRLSFHELKSRFNLHFAEDRDTKEMNARSTVGQLATKAKVSRRKAAAAKLAGQVRGSELLIKVNNINFDPPKGNASQAC